MVQQHTGGIRRNTAITKRWAFLLSTFLPSKSRKRMSEITHTTACLLTQPSTYLPIVGSVSSSTREILTHVRVSPLLLACGPYAHICHRPPRTFVLPSCHPRLREMTTIQAPLPDARKKMARPGLQRKRKMATSVTRPPPPPPRSSSPLKKLSVGLVWFSLGLAAASYVPPPTPTPAGRRPSLSLSQYTPMMLDV